MTQFLLRRAEASDSDAVAHTLIESRAAAPIPESIHPPDDVRRWVREQLLPTHEVWVASVGAEVVAMLAMNDGWVDQLFVLPSHAGRGIGSALLQVAKDSHPAGLQLWVFVSNEPAQQFYQRHGFVEVERTAGHANEERAPDIRYEWSPAT